jgi:paraquat-inducible protein A
MSSQTESETVGVAVSSLRELYPGRLWVAVLLLGTIACLLAGQVLPGVTLEAIGRETEHYSVMGGVIDLWRLGHPLLATVLFCFSIVFPSLKLLALCWMWFRPMPARGRAQLGHWLKALGKWSMLDTFVVAALIGSVQLSRVITAAKATAEPAVYFFATAILLSIFLSFVIGSLADRAWGEAHQPPKLGVSMVIAPWLAAALFVAGLLQPLLLIEKKLLENVYALPESLGDLIEVRQFFLLAMLVLFVIGLPLVYFCGLGFVALAQRCGRSVDLVLPRLVTLERWAMVDVYFLGLMLVDRRVSNIAAVTRPAGFWLIAATALLSIYCAYRLRRVW